MSYLNRSSWVLVSAWLPSVATAREALPTPSASGDYSIAARGWYLWQVVATDPSGLNCRATQEFVEGTWMEPSYAGTLPSDIQNFPVVRRFPSGTVLFVNTVPAGFSIWNDDHSKPWVRVRLSKESDSMCFVRANTRYVKPVYSSLQ